MPFFSSHAALVLGCFATASAHVPPGHDRSGSDIVHRRAPHAVHPTRRGADSNVHAAGRLARRSLPQDGGQERQAFLVRKGGAAQEPHAAHRGSDAAHVADGLSELKAPVEPRSSCAPLKNHGTHATMQIEVGTPGQKFDVVADTGSNFVIIPSCMCVEQGRCEPNLDCFLGTNKSSTFEMNQKGSQVPLAYIRFGSGDLFATVATDEVRVSSETAVMKDSLLLIVSEHFSVTGINGIFGLGPPSSNLTTGDGEKRIKDLADSHTPKSGGLRRASNPHSEHALPHVDDMSGDNKGTKSHGEDAGSAVDKSTGRASSDDHVHPQGVAATRDSTNISASVKGFLGAAGIDRFTLCFNENADGVLRFRTPPAPKELSSIGIFHWGLDLRGVSVGGGESLTSISVCDPSDMPRGQKTACGAIPDSGTTMIMAPEAHLVELFGKLCDQWERCTSYVGKARGHDGSQGSAKHEEHHVGTMRGLNQSNGLAKHEAFVALLQDCAAWRDGDDGLDELPDLHIHLRGGDEHSGDQTLLLTGNDYVLETEEEEVKFVTNNLMGVLSVDAGMYTGKAGKRVCVPAFGAMEFATQENGPVWILGTPIFYAFQVGYNQAQLPPAISFSEGACGSCHADSLLEAEGTAAGAVAASGSRALRTVTTLRSRLTRPRRIRGAPRLPSWDHRAHL